MNACRSPRSSKRVNPRRVSSSIERRRSRTRQELIEATHELILKRGIDGLSLRQVAAEMDYSAGALYGYFENKEALVDAVRAECFERLNTSMMERIAGAETASEQLRLGALAYLDFARANPIDYHLMFGVGPSASTQNENHAIAQRALRFIVDGGIERNEIVTDGRYDADTIAHHCWATVHGLAMLQATVVADRANELEPMAHEIIARVISLFAPAKKKRR